MPLHPRPGRLGERPQSDLEGPGQGPSGPLGSLWGPSGSDFVNVLLRFSVIWGMYLGMLVCSIMCFCVCFCVCLRCSIVVLTFHMFSIVLFACLLAYAFCLSVRFLQFVMCFCSLAVGVACFVCLAVCLFVWLFDC